jgi:hypothetical protein
LKTTVYGSPTSVRPFAVNVSCATSFSIHAIALPVESKRTVQWPSNCEWTATGNAQTSVNAKSTDASVVP